MVGMTSDVCLSVCSCCYVDECLSSGVAVVVGVGASRVPNDGSLLDEIERDGSDDSDDHDGSDEDCQDDGLGLAAAAGGTIARVIQRSRRSIVNASGLHDLDVSAVGVDLTGDGPDPAQGAAFAFEVGGDLDLASYQSHSTVVGNRSDDILLEALFGDRLRGADAVAHVSSVLDGWLPRHVVFLSSFVGFGDSSGGVEGIAAAGLLVNEEVVLAAASGRVSHVAMSFRRRDEVLACDQIGERKNHQLKEGSGSLHYLDTHSTQV